MTVLVVPTKVTTTSFSSMEASPDLVPVDEQFGETHSAFERGEAGEESFFSTIPTNHDDDDDDEEEDDGNIIINNNNSTTTATTANSNNDDNTNSCCGWDLTTLYLPLLWTVWLHQSMLGTVQFLRTLMVGQLIRFQFLEIIFHGMMKENSSLWLWLQQNWLCYPMTKTITSSAGRYCHAAVTGDPRAWPPPALTALAIVTLFTLVIHPDGLTWIVLRKLRDIIMETLFALCRCWEVLMDDYGLLTTLAAATTLAAIFFLGLIVWRTLSPKSKPLKIPHTEKKKKKKKANSRKRDHHHPQQQRCRPASVSSDRIKSFETSLPTVDGISSQMGSADMAGEECNQRKFSVDHRMENMSPINEAKPSLGYDRCCSLVPDSSSTVPPLTLVDNTSAMLVQEVKTRYSSTAERNRISSTSTLETTALSDDQSCESSSVRSFPSVGATSTRSGDKINNKKKSTGTPRRNKRGSQRLSSSTPDRLPNRNQKGGNGGGNVGSATAVVPHVSSRWDALKPEQGNGSIDGRNTMVSNRHQQTLHPHPHAKTRRKENGNNGVGDKKKGLSRHAGYGKKITPPTTTQNLRSSRISHRFTKSCSNRNTHVTGSSVVVVTPESSPMSNFIPPPPPGFHNESTQNESNTIVTTPWDGLPTVGSPAIGLNIPKDQDVVTALLHTPIPPHAGECSDWMDIDRGLFSSLTVSANHVPFGGSVTTKTQENPFIANHMFQTDLDSQIEAELQELGGQMAGSILDF